MRKTATRKTAFALGVALALAVAAPPAAGAEPAGAKLRSAVFPLKVSANKRYLVDQDGTPFLMVGDSPQALIGNLSEGRAKKFMANRASYGVNALWINLLCASYTACHANATTYDGIAPFMTGTDPSNYDLSTPNPDYFARADAMINLAANYGIVVILDPIETGSFLATLQANGIAKAKAYGEYLGNRYKDFPNIIWMHGNDFQSWHTDSDNELVRAVAAGIHKTDRNHIQTTELDYLVSATFDDERLKPLMALNAVYTYEPTYAKLLEQYERPDFGPMFMVEANYEFEHNGGTDGGSIPNLRKQEYWTMLSGATGQLYGSQYTWRLDGDWQNNLDTVGIQQFKYMKKLFQGRKWHELVPDRAAKVVTAGRGTFSDTDPIDTDTYVTAGRTPDGTLVMAYMPSRRKITVDMTKLSGPVTARWYDPTNGTYIAIDGSPFKNKGSRGFIPPMQNNDGDGDWVLVLEAP